MGVWHSCCVSSPIACTVAASMMASTTLSLPYKSYHVPILSYVSVFWSIFVAAKGGLSCLGCLAMGWFKNYDPQLTMANHFYSTPSLDVCMVLKPVRKRPSSGPSTISTQDPGYLEFGGSLSPSYALTEKWALHPSYGKLRGKKNIDHWIGGTVISVTCQLICSSIIWRAEILHIYVAHCSFVTQFWRENPWYCIIYHDANDATKSWIGSKEIY